MRIISYQNAAVHYTAGSKDETLCKEGHHTVIIYSHIFQLSSLFQLNVSCYLSVSITFLWQ